MAKILIVEDDPYVADAYRDLLCDRDHQVAFAYDGESALPTAQAVRPDLILMDSNLPGLDGLGAIARLKSAAETASIPIIACSGNADDPTLMREFREAGCEACVVKSRPAEVLRIVEEVLARKEEL